MEQRLSLDMLPICIDLCIVTVACKQRAAYGERAFACYCRLCLSIQVSRGSLELSSRKLPTFAKGHVLDLDVADDD